MSVCLWAQAWVNPNAVGVGKRVVGHRQSVGPLIVQSEGASISRIRFSVLKITKHIEKTTWFVVDLLRVLDGESEVVVRILDCFRATNLIPFVFTDR